MITEQATNAVPRISANKLAEYIVTSNPVRRAQIVKDAKTPSNFIVTRYKDARESIVSYLMNGFNEEILNESIEHLKSLTPETPFVEDDIRNSIIAMELAREIEIEEINGCVIERNGTNNLVNVKGVNVSINPDLIITNIATNKVGALKLHISKSNILNDEALSYVGVLLYTYLLNIGIEEKKINENICISVDCFSTNYKTAPKSYKRMFARIEAACAEFLLKWNSID